MTKLIDVQLVSFLECKDICTDSLPVPGLIRVPCVHNLIAIRRQNLQRTSVKIVLEDASRFI
jgi:hypothetical protein